VGFARHERRRHLLEDVVERLVVEEHPVVVVPSSELRASVTNVAFIRGPSLMPARSFQPGSFGVMAMGNCEAS
jgi:hypothetical protein